jgi:LPS-assembly protein
MNLNPFADDPLDIMKKLIAQLTLLTALLTTTAGLAPAAETDLAAPGGVKINADSIGYDKKTDSYVATGNVRIDWSGMMLFADQVSVRQSDNLATAQGNILVRKNEDTLSGEQATLNLDTQQGEVTEGKLFVKQGNFHVTGATLMKSGEDDYQITDGTFTTCDGDSPSWKFGATKLDITRGSYAVGKNAVFYIKDVPVFYFPYILFPVKEERQSGLLIPRFGLSSKKGFYLEIPYYHVLSPSQDITYYLDIQTKRGAGVGADYRYLLRNGGRGETNAYLMYDTDREKTRGTLNLRHQQPITDTLSLTADINMVLDRDFYRDFSDFTGEYNKQYLESSVFMTKHWQRYSLTTELRYTQDLYAESNRETLQKLPIITFTGIKQQVLNTPVYFSLDSSFTNFYRRDGLQGQRLDLHPMLTYYTSPAGLIDTAAWIGYRQRLYNTYGDSTASGFSSRALFDAGASLSTTLVRTYDINRGRLQRIRHTIVPEVSYSYLSEEDQDDLPFYDYSDRLVAQNMIGYSLTTYLTGKYLSEDNVATYRDLAYLRIFQGYEFSGSYQDVLNLVNKDRSFTDIRIEAKLNPTQHLALILDSYFDPYQVNFSSINTAVSASDTKGNSIGLGYRYSEEDVKYLEAKLSVSYINPFAFHYHTRYSFDTSKFLESYYALEYKQQCWGIMLSFRERPDNRSFLVSFTLSGVGAIGKFKSF